MSKYWILLLFLVGCGNVALPNQDKAIQLVWHEVFQEADSPPDIYWVETLNCHDMEGYFQGRAPTAVVESGKCVAGAYWPDWNWIDLAHNSDVFSETAFTHELLHAHLRHLFGSGDGEHSRPEWGTSQGRTPDIWDFGQETLIVNAL
jgi:hypothetical protein